MKNIQVIDGAVNSIFEIYRVPNALFDLMFPEGTDIAFIDDVENAFGMANKENLWDQVYRNRVDKKRVRGIHGTLHLTGSAVSKKYFQTRKEAEVNQGRT